MIVSNDKIILAGIPRCGTTVMARALAGLPCNKVWPRIRTRLTETNGVLKTHEPFSDDLVSGYDRAVFIFGDIVLAVLSLVRGRGDEVSRRILGIPRCADVSDLMSSDRAGLMAIFNSWKRPTIPTLRIRYETMWDHIKEIEKFTGRDLNLLPPYRRRRSWIERFDSRHVENVKSTYSELIDEIDKAPDLEVVG